MDGVQETGDQEDADRLDGVPDHPQRVAALRGAGVQVDGARVGYVAAVVGLVVVMAVAGVLLAAGIKKNSQIDSLNTKGVPVELTVTRCLALIGGTGQSPAGFECTGTYTYRGRRYVEGVPGTTNLPVGASVHGIVASDDPALFSTPSAVASERTSVAPVVLPAVVLAAAAASCVWVVIRHRRKVAEH